MPGYNEVDEGSGDSGVMATNGPSRDAVKKLDQIIQVDSTAVFLFFERTLMLLSLELSYESRYSRLAVKDAITGDHHERWNQES
jgi:hypothetical protein